MSRLWGLKNRLELSWNPCFHHISIIFSSYFHHISMIIRSWCPSTWGLCSLFRGPSSWATGPGIACRRDRSPSVQFSGSWRRSDLGKAISVQQRNGATYQKNIGFLWLLYIYIHIYIYMLFCFFEWVYTRIRRCRLSTVWVGISFSIDSIFLRRAIAGIPLKLIDSYPVLYSVLFGTIQLAACWIFP